MVVSRRKQCLSLLSFTAMLCLSHFVTVVNADEWDNEDPRVAAGMRAQAAMDETANMMKNIRNVNKKIKKKGKKKVNDKMKIAAKKATQEALDKHKGDAEALANFERVTREAAERRKLRKAAADKEAQDEMEAVVKPVRERMAKEKAEKEAKEKTNDSATETAAEEETEEVTQEAEESGSEL